ncbi:MAG TPA: gluconate 2-dehydrogenase subunit 3 family protein, partial [Woeseiaceae bacterium]|nr:gluconate 2-dehydrogenase subunit 3 family protein [Woeseiaceae bacterium]
PPFTTFYRNGLGALESAARTSYGNSFVSLDAGRQRELVGLMGREEPPGWKGGPPAPFFFFVLRNDALDVTYGTVAGFDELELPYRAHIAPPTRWGS